MALHLAGSLAKLSRFDKTDILRRYTEWWRVGAFDTGPTTASVLEKVASGIDSEKAVELVDLSFGGRTGGCGPAHRAAPLAMATFIKTDDLASCAKAEARLTHASPLAGAASAAAVLLCRYLSEGYDWDYAVMNAASNQLPEIARIIGSWRDQPIDTGGFAPVVLHAACFFVGTSSEFEEALDRAIDFAGPDNYCPVLVGSIGGAHWGSDAIDQRHIPHKAIIEKISQVTRTLVEPIPG